MWKTTKYTRKKILKDRNKWKDIQYSWMEDLILIRYHWCPKLSTNLMQSWSKSQQYVSSEIIKSTLKFIGNLKGYKIAKTILNNENKIGTLPDYKTYKA